MIIWIPSLILSRNIKKKTHRFTHNGRNLATKTNSYLFCYSDQKKKADKYYKKANKISISIIKAIYFVAIKHNVDIQNIGN